MSDKIKTFKIQSINDIDVLLNDDILEELQEEGQGIDDLPIDYENVDGIKPDAGFFGFIEVTGTSYQMVGNYGYIANNVAQVSLNLPVKADFGKRIIVSGKGTGGWKVTQNAGQKIIFGKKETTEGVGGYLESTDQYDSLEIVCTVANTTFEVISSVGNIIII